MFAYRLIGHSDYLQVSKGAPCSRLGFVEFMYQKCNKFTLASAGMYVLTQWREHVETDSVYYYVSNQDLLATPL